MKFSGGTVLLVLGIAGPLIASAFVPNVSFSRHASTTRTWESESKRRTTHTRVNRVVALRMSEAVEEAPVEVVAMDGVETSEEAHTVDRPARSSTSKRRNAGGNKGTPLAELEVGAEMQGTVKAVTNYGAFLDIGAATDALCHVSRLSDDFVSDVNDVVSVGDAVTVRIINVDTEKGQVAVTMRSEEAEANAAARGRGGGGRSKDRPRRSNGDREAQRTAMASLAETGYDEDAFVEGEVQSTLDFGAFVRFSIGDLGEGLEGEIDGLVHISVLTEGRVNQVTDVVKAGDKVKVRVKALDVSGGKVSLSMLTKEQEPKRREGGGGRRGKSQFTEEEMGAADWKESLEEFQQDMPTFKNMPVVVDNRK